MLLAILLIPLPIYIGYRLMGALDRFINKIPRV